MAAVQHIVGVAPPAQRLAGESVWVAQQHVQQQQPADTPGTMMSFRQTAYAGILTSSLGSCLAIQRVDNQVTA